MSRGQSKRKKPVSHRRLKSNEKAAHPEAIKQEREIIDHLDDEILKLLNERAQAARRIGLLKEDLNLQFHSPERERQVFRRLEKANQKLGGRFPAPAVHRVFREIMSAALALEKPLRVAFLGPKATFTHLACI